MTDPRSPNCRRYSEEAGLVTGVELIHLPNPGSTYELIRATLVDEAAAQGNIVATVQVLGADGVPARVNCYLVYPWAGWQPGQDFQNKLLPGNPNIPYQHMIHNGFDPGAGPGPLAISIGTFDAAVDSDVVGGLGLPHNRHVSYDLVFRERGGGEPGGNGDLAGIEARLQRIEDKLDHLSQHLGAA